MFFFKLSFVRLQNRNLLFQILDYYLELMLDTDVFTEVSFVLLNLSLDLSQVLMSSEWSVT